MRSGIANGLIEAELDDKTLEGRAVQFRLRGHRMGRVGDRHSLGDGRTGGVGGAWPHAARDGDRVYDLAARDSVLQLDFGAAAAREFVLLSQFDEAMRFSSRSSFLRSIQA